MMEACVTCGDLDHIDEMIEALDYVDAYRCVRCNDFMADLYDSAVEEAERDLEALPDDDE